MSRRVTSPLSVSPESSGSSRSSRSFVLLRESSFSCRSWPAASLSWRSPSSSSPSSSWPKKLRPNRLRRPPATGRITCYDVSESVAEIRLVLRKQERAEIMQEGDRRSHLKHPSFWWAGHRIGAQSAAENRPDQPDMKSQDRRPEEFSNPTRALCEYLIKLFYRICAELLRIHEQPVDVQSRRERLKIRISVWKL